MKLLLPIYCTSTPVSMSTTLLVSEKSKECGCYRPHYMNPTKSIKAKQKRSNVSRGGVIMQRNLSGDLSNMKATTTSFMESSSSNGCGPSFACMKMVSEGIRKNKRVDKENFYF